jgi:hypothetical protein
MKEKLMTNRISRRALTCAPDGEDHRSISCPPFLRRFPEGGEEAGIGGFDELRLLPAAQ